MDITDSDMGYDITGGPDTTRVSRLSSQHLCLFPRDVIIHCEDGKSKFFRNDGIHLPDRTALHTKQIFVVTAITNLNLIQCYNKFFSLKTRVIR
jgi:hypothetical protein